MCVHGWVRVCIEITTERIWRGGNRLYTIPVNTTNQLVIHRLNLVRKFHSSGENTARTSSDDFTRHDEAVVVVKYFQSAMLRGRRINIRQHFRIHFRIRWWRHAIEKSRLDLERLCDKKRTSTPGMVSRARLISQYSPSETIYYNSSMLHDDDYGTTVVTARTRESIMRRPHLLSLQTKTLSWVRVG